MHPPAIDIQAISKRYRLGVIGARTFRDELGRLWSRLRRFPNPHSAEKLEGKAPSEIWALRDVSFQVEPGEVVGLIGKNGAGKSTLLKILTRITEPTSGRAVLQGRVGSLLEVGTGFHPELTGRENIFLNGTILGMRKTEIAAKFDEIVDFSGVEKFIDTPVKRYSSGMRVRLGFAVAAHLNPEILLIDEVLAVGDVEFQKRCLGKMESIAQAGRTVLFVSHNMLAVSNLCPRTVLLENGKVVYDGETEEAIHRYTMGARNSVHIDLASRQDREGSQILRFTGYRIAVGDAHEPRALVRVGEDVRILIDYEIPGGKPLANVEVACRLSGGLSQSVCVLGSSYTGDSWPTVPVRGTFECVISKLPVQVGDYSLTAFAAVKGQIADWIQDVGIFEVGTGDFFGSGRTPKSNTGSVLVDHAWRVHSDEAERSPGDNTLPSQNPVN